MRKSDEEEGEAGAGRVLEVSVSPTARLTLSLRMKDSHCWGVSREMIRSGKCLTGVIPTV